MAIAPLYCKNNTMEIEEYIRIYRDGLLNDVTKFWEKHSPDRECGGYFTCLDREGRVFDTDKFIWLQCRQVWTFSMLYNNVERREEWLNMALHGAGFLLAHGRDGEGNWYFSLTREGKPLIAPYNVFSDCFAAMAFGQLYFATGDMQYRVVAQATFNNIIRRKDNPAGKYTKAVPGTRPLLSLGLPMILSNLVLQIEKILDPALVEQVINDSVFAVMNLFYRSDRGILLERVTPDGGVSDSFDGRLVNPGHGLESMWFMMDIASRNGDARLMKQAVDISINLMEFGWDKQFGGIFYFLDIKGHPPQQLEWDQKLWWVHQEAILAMLKGYQYTGDRRCWHWFEILHAYSWARFPDSEFGEWYGYLNRRGEVLLPLKGGKWKGCFHSPRFLHLGWKALESVQETNRTKTQIVT